MTDRTRTIAEWPAKIPHWSKPLVCPACGPERKHLITQYSDALLDADMGVPPRWQCWGCGQVMGYPYRVGEEPTPERTGELP